MPSRHVARPLFLLLAAGVFPSVALGQAPDTTAAGDSARIFRLDGVNVTATREPRTVFSTPAPVTVIGPEHLRRSRGTNASDLFLEIPGLDAEGVGPAQRRPVVRGMRGQRVLLLEDGMRLNNPRRRVDSGEPTALVWGASLQRVEVVRGAASVLYGSDAIGGVVNLVTRGPPVPGERLGGFVESSVRSEGRAATLSGEVAGAAGPLGWMISGGLGDAVSYRAPSGTFGELTLPVDVEVHDSGAREASLRIGVRYDLGSDRAITLRHEGYGSRESGFGWIDPEYFGSGTAKTRLAWPRQDFDRTVLGFRDGALGWSFADAVDLTLYRQSNEREFVTEVFAPIAAVPGATTEVVSENFTDVDGDGLRLEVRKLVGTGATVTYGLDLSRDRSAGTDTSTTTITGLGPTTVVGRGGPQVPDARQRHLGVFVQLQNRIAASTEVVVGARYQDVHSESLLTPGNDTQPATYSEGTLVGSVSLLQGVGDRVTLVGSVARGFRTPNLVERFFTGLTAGNRGYWEANPELGPETSLSLELGGRLRTSRVGAEVFVFQNTLLDGIVLEPTGDTIGRAVVYRNVNVDELRYRGVDASVTVFLAGGLGLEADATLLDVEDRRDPDRVLADSYPNKLRLALRYDDDAGRWWASYGVRRNGRRDTLEGTTPVGDAIPAFVVHGLRGGVRVAGRHRLGAAVENLTDVLYSEAFNSGFFRPEPGRSFVLSWAVAF